MPPKEKSSTERFLELVADIEGLFKNYVPQEDFMKVMKIFEGKVQKLKDEIDQKIAETKGVSENSLNEMRVALKGLSSTVSKIKPDENSRKVPDILRTIDSIQRQITEEVEALRESIPEVPEIPDHSEALGELGERLTKTEELIVGENIRNALEVLQGDERLDKSAIRGIEELEESIKNGKHIEIKGSSRGLFLSIDGVEKGILQNINLKAGTNMAIAYSQVNGQDTITFNATGGGPGGISVETPTGTVNAVNTTFTPSAEPQWIVADGITYYDGAGYTWSSPNIIMDVPPSASIRAII